MIKTIKYKTIVIAFLLAIISIVPSMAQEFTATPINSEQYNKWKTSKPFTQALEALQNDETKDAVDGFTKELKLHPDNAYAMCNLAQANCLMHTEQLLDEVDKYSGDTTAIIAANKKFRELVKGDVKMFESSIAKLPSQDKESQCAAYLALGEMLSIYCYDDEAAILKAYSNAIAVEDGTTVYLDFTSNGQYSSFEYKIEEFVPVEDFQPIDKDIAVDFSLTPTSVKVSAENKGERVSMNNKYLALFYSDGKLTHVSEETCADENGVIEPGETAENECQYYGVGTPDKARVFFHAYSTAVAAVRE